MKSSADIKKMYFSPVTDELALVQESCILSNSNKGASTEEWDQVNL